MRTVIEDAELAATVKDLDLNWSSGVSENIWDEDSGKHDLAEAKDEANKNCDADELALLGILANAARRFDIRLAKAILRGFMTAQVILLLHLLPNLQSLEARSSIAFYELFCRLNDLLPFHHSGKSDWARFIPVALLSVKRITLKYFDDEQGVSLMTVLPLFFLPSLFSLVLDYISAAEVYYEIDTFPDESASYLSSLHGRSSVTELDFMSSNVEANAFAHLLQFPESLQNLSYDCTTSVAGHPFSRDGFGITIRSLKNPGALRHLTLDVSALGEDLDWIVEDETVGPLNCLTSLVYLNIDLVSLLGNKDETRDENDLVNLLPPSIQRLKIKVTGRGWDLCDDVISQLLPVVMRPSSKLENLV